MKALLPASLSASLAFVLTASFVNAAPPIPDSLKAGGFEIGCQFLDEYKTQGFAGPISIEYEYNWDANVADAKLCMDYVRAYGAKK